MSKETREYAKQLVSQMTLEEKMSQMVYQSPAIERLGIPAYNWWNEALHGVARAGVATVFPQAIGLAATFDKELLQEIGDVVSTEGRAKFNEFSRKGDRGIYKGLTFWAPNVNIFRDPRWGRGHETYGEDPYLTGELGCAYIRGLQGPDPDHPKAAACAKHFAVHSGPEAIRHEFDAEADQFEKIREAEAKKAQAEAQRYAMEQEALGIKAKGEAEAASIRAQALAEAEGMEKKAEAYQRYNKAAMAEMMIKVLPEIAGKIAEPLSQIDKITIIGGGSEDNGIGSVAGNVPVVMAKLFESMKEATGVDLSEIMRADTYDAKVNRNIQISSPEELKEYLKAEAGKAAADAESPEKAEASEPVQKDGSEQ